MSEGTHTYTHATNAKVRLIVERIDGPPIEKLFTVAVAGEVDTAFRPDLYQRSSEKIGKVKR